MIWAINDSGSGCQQCGTCCVGPDISSIGKPIGVACRHLDSEMRCAIYPERPDVCRRYMADEICRMVAAPSLEERVEKYLDLFGLLDDPIGSSQGHRCECVAVASTEVQR